MCLITLTKILPPPRIYNTPLLFALPSSPLKCVIIRPELIYYTIGLDSTLKTH